MRKLIAVCIADVHLDANIPRFRSTEENWLKKQEEALKEVFEIANNRGNSVPLLIAGDLFNSAQPPPEIINFALDMFGGLSFPVYAIPGNHDLPNHRYEDMNKSAYGTLVKAHRIKSIPPKEFYAWAVGISTGYLRVRVWGYPCGFKVEPLSLINGEQTCGLDIALVHDYIWTRACSYQGAPEVNYCTSYLDRLKGFDVAVFGDNHLGFCLNRDVNISSCSVLNCGSLLIRKSDERSPKVGRIYSDGTVDRIDLDVSQDKYNPSMKEKAPEPEPMQMEEKEALEAFATTGEQAYNFSECLRHLVQQKKYRLHIKELILESLGDK